MSTILNNHIKLDTHYESNSTYSGPVHNNESRVVYNAAGAPHNLLPLVEVAKINNINKMKRIFNIK